MKILSLFDGMSCGQLALGKEHNHEYYASEIDKYAIKVTQANFPNTIQLGDIRNIEPFDVDLVMGGFPCQDLSFAGKGAGLEGKRSGLFYECLKFIPHAKWFMFENVVMKKEHENKISELLGVKPILINASLVSAQNRRRLFWTNIPGVTQPEDQNIKLKDILELGENILWQRPRGNNKGGFREDKSPSVTACSWQENVKVMCGAIRGRYIVNGKRADGQGKTTQRLELRTDEKTNCITTVQKDNVVVFVDRPKSHCIDANYAKGISPEYYFKKSRRQLVFKESPDGFLYRKLLPIEVERLFNVPDNYTNHVSNSQRYRMLGNGWVVNVIKHILDCIPKENKNDKL